MDNDEDEVFIGRDLAHARPYSEEVAGKIDDEVKKIIDGCYAKAEQILKDNRNVLDEVAKLSLKREDNKRGIWRHCSLKI